MAARRTRLWVNFSPERFDLFRKWATQLELPMGQLVAMCAWAGAQMLIPRLLPQERQQLDLIGGGPLHEEIEEWLKERMEHAHQLVFVDGKDLEEFRAWRREKVTDAPTN